MEVFPEAAERVQLWTEVIEEDGKLNDKKGLLYDYIKQRVAKKKLARQLAAN